MLLSLAFVYRYGAHSWGCHNFGKFHMVLLGLSTLLAMAQVVTILMSRHHYSVDIVVALYTTPLLWIVYNDRFHPEDMQVDFEQLKLEIERNQDLPYWRRAIKLVRTLAFLSLLIISFLVVVHGNFHWFWK